MPTFQSTRVHHTDIVSLNLLVLLTACLVVTGPHPLKADEPIVKITRQDVINVSSDEAWEAIEPETVHFRGNFQMRSENWQLTSNAATLIGPLDAPEYVSLTGSPAQVILKRSYEQTTELITGSANEIVYSRASNSLLLYGSATLGQDGNEMRSNIIEYDISTDRFHSRGDDGVQLNVDPPD